MTEHAAQPDPRSGSEDDVRYLPVPATEGAVEASPARPIEPARSPSLPAAAAAAAGGFMLGAATFVLVRVLRQRRAQRALGRLLTRRGATRRGGVEIAGSRSFLVDIHLLRR